MKRNITIEQTIESNKIVESVLASVLNTRIETSYRARLYAESERKFFAVIYNCNEHAHNNNTEINMSDVLVIIDVNYSIMKALEKESIKYDFSFAEKNNTKEENDFFRFNLTATDTRRDAIIKAMNTYTEKAHATAQKKKEEEEKAKEEKAKEKALAQKKKEKKATEKKATEKKATATEKKEKK